MAMDVAITGDSIINRRVSVVEHPRFRSLVETLRAADVSFTHLDTNLLEFDDPAAYPAAEAGGTWMRSPPYVADELSWMGFDVVSHASNHALDYSYGGLRSTWSALDRVDIPVAGTGENLGDARSPVYLETPAGRVALVSMTSTLTPWSRAGEDRRDMRGRPGNNPMRFHHEVDGETLEDIKGVARSLGWWVNDLGEGRWWIHPSGIHNSGHLFVEGEETTTVPDEHDLAGNLRAIEDAANQADVVIGHLHTHEFDASGHLQDPAPFTEEVARAGIDAGADVFVTQGVHSPLRGIELHQGKPILYDPGDFFRMTDSVERLPADFYERWAHRLDEHPADATPSRAILARKGVESTGFKPGFNAASYPEGGYLTGSTMGNVTAVCTVDDGELTGLELHPGMFLEEPTSKTAIGVPHRAEGERAAAIIDDIGELSAPYGTTVRFEEGVGIVEV